MLQKFFTDTFISKTIKNIIKNTNLYTLPTVNYGDYIVKGCDYIYKYNIIRCNQSGNLYNNYSVVGGMNNQIYAPNYMHNVTSQYGYYDTKTHIYLGRCLRQYRDLYDIDLMPFYNCFSYQMETGRMLRVYTTEENINNGKKVITKKVVLEPYESSAYKTFLIPIFFNKTYTVAIDSKSQVLMKPVIYDDLGPIKSYKGEQNKQYIHDYIDSDDTVYEMINGDVQNAHNSEYIKSGTQFSNPFKIRVNTSQDDDTAKLLYKYYHNLYLMIQVDKSNSSSIVVIEGDLSNGKRSVIDTNKNDRNIDQESPIQKNMPMTLKMNQAFLSNLSLLKTNDGVSYPFSDRLVEYLVNAVVTQKEYLDGNIQKVQEVLKINHKTLGIWDDSIRSYLYNYYTNDSSYEPLDDNGYFNKDIERLFIQKGKIQ